MQIFSQATYFRKKSFDHQKINLFQIQDHLPWCFACAESQESNDSYHFEVILQRVSKFSDEASKSEIWSQKTPPGTDKIIMKRIKNCCAKSYLQIIFLTELQDWKDKHWLWSTKNEKVLKISEKFVISLKSKIYLKVPQKSKIQDSGRVLRTMLKPHPQPPASA